AEGKSMAHHELLLIERHFVEEVDIGVHKPGEEQSAGPEDAERLCPDRSEVRAEHVRHGVDDDVERVVVKSAEVPHIAQNSVNLKPLTCGNLVVTSKLPGRIVKHRYDGACGCEDRPLLTSTRSEAEHAHADQLWRKPIARCGFMADEDHRPVTFARTFKDFRTDRPRPFDVAVNETVPGDAVMCNWI